MKKLVCMVVGMTASSLFANVVVTDEVPTDRDVRVPAGEEVEIRGSGLTSDCTLTLGDGAKLKFYVTATVAAPVTTTGDAVFETSDDSVIGTISGKLTANFTDVEYLDVVAPGLLRFTGGGAIYRTAGGFRMKTGQAEIASNIFGVNANLLFAGGRLTIRDGGSWQCTGNGVGHLRLDQAQTEDACLEIATGGSVYYGNNDLVYIGGNSDYESKLLISGGDFWRNTNDSIYLNSAGGGNGVVEITAGALRSDIPITVNNKTGIARLLLNGGTWQSKSGASARTSLLNGNGSCDVVVGGFFTLDLGGFAGDSIYSQESTVVGAWSSSAGGVLKVLGKADGRTNFVLRDFAGDGLAFDLNGDNKVVLEIDNAQDDVSLGWALPGQAESRIVATGTSPALAVSYLLADGAALTAPLSTAWCEGFSSVTTGDIVVDAGANAFTYISRAFVDSVKGVITQVSGTLVMDTDPGSQKLVRTGGTVYFQDADPLVLSNTTKYVSDVSGWQDADGASSPWRAGAVANVNTIGSDGSLDGRLVAYGIKVGGSGNNYWDGGTGRFEIGAGGLEFVQSKMWALASAAKQPRVVLGANQTWTNATASGTAYMQFGFGWHVPDYFNAYLTAAPGVTDWRIGGRFETWLYSPDNDLSDVTVTVTEPATIRLVGNIDARLHAGKLVLDGADMAFGRHFPSVDTLKGDYTSGTIADAGHLAPELTLANGGSLSVDGLSAVFAIPSVTGKGGGNVISGSRLVVTQSVTAVSVPTAADALTFDILIDEAVPTSFAVSGEGTLAFGLKDAPLNADVVFSDGGSLRLSGSGTCAGGVSGAGALEIAADGYVGFAGDLTGFLGNEISVSSGVLVLPNVGALPEGVKVVTSGDGALALMDGTGFDSDVHMGGTKKLVGQPGTLFVTDEPRENEALVVGNGETLVIFGDGLKASSSVEIRDGASIRFGRTATVRATLSVPASVTGTNPISIAAAEGVVGTFAGKYDVKAAPSSALYHDLSGNGLVVFEGGIDLALQNIFRANGGRALVKTSFVTRDEVTMLSGEIAFTNCAVTCGGKAGTFFQLASTSQYGDVKLSLLAGSTMDMSNNRNLYIGRVNGLESRFVLDGGTLTTSSPDDFKLCPGGSGIGIFDFRSGSFETRRSISAGTGGTSRFLWSGGTIKGYYSAEGFGKDVLIEGPMTEVRLCGDCTLDLYRFTKPSVTVLGHEDAVLSVSPGAHLTVKSDIVTAGWCAKAVFPRFNGEGLALKLVGSDKNGNPTVEIANATGPVDLAWDVTGAGLVKATGTAPVLVASYFVPTGASFVNANVNTDWYEGFASASVGNLTFAEGSIYVLQPSSGTYQPLLLGGSLILPPTMSYRVDRTAGAMPNGEGIVLIEAAGGVSGTCDWKRLGGIGRSARIYAEADALKMDHPSVGCGIFVR